MAPPCGRTRGGSAANPTDETLRCVEAWHEPLRGGRLAPDLSILYALEVARSQPAVWRDGACAQGALAVAVYWHVRAETAGAHAARLRQLLAPMVGTATDHTALGAAEAALSAEWQLLTALDVNQAVRGC